MFDGQLTQQHWESPALAQNLHDAAPTAAQSPNANEVEFTFRELATDNRKLQKQFYSHLLLYRYPDRLHVSIQRRLTNLFPELATWFDVHDFALLRHGLMKLGVTTSSILLNTNAAARDV